MWLLLFCVSLFRVFLFFSFFVDIWTFYRSGISGYIPKLVMKVFLAIHVLYGRYISQVPTWVVYDLLHVGKV